MTELTFDICATQNALEIKSNHGCEEYTHLFIYIKLPHY